MKRFIIPIGRFISESVHTSSEDREKQISDLKALTELEEFGLVDTKTVNVKRRELMNGEDHEELMRDPVIGPLILSTAFHAMESETFKRLQALGYTCKSTPTQIINGTIMLSTPTSVGTGYDGATVSIAIYKDGTIRRLGYGDRPQKLKPGTGAGVSFYVEAMKWIEDRIDSTDSHLASKTTTAGAKKRQTEASSLSDLLSAKYVAFGLTQEETNRIIRPMLFNGMNPKETNMIKAEQRSLAAAVKEGIRRGVMPVINTLCFETSLSPELSNLIVDREIPWTLVSARNGSSSAIDRLTGRDFVAQTFWLSMNSEIRSQLKQPVNFKAIRYFRPVMLMKLESNCSTWFIQYHLDSIKITQSLVKTLVGDGEWNVEFYFKNCDISEDIVVPGTVHLEKIKGNGKVTCKVPTSTSSYSNTVSIGNVPGAMVNVLTDGKARIDVMWSGSPNVILEIDGKELKNSLRVNQSERNTRLLSLIEKTNLLKFIVYKGYSEEDAKSDYDQKHHDYYEGNTRKTPQYGIIGTI